MEPPVSAINPCNSPEDVRPRVNRHGRCHLIGSGPLIEGCNHVLWKVIFRSKGPDDQNQPKYQASIAGPNTMQNAAAGARNDPKATAV
jgi:hypothetical protein